MARESIDINEIRELIRQACVDGRRAEARRYIERSTGLTETLRREFRGLYDERNEAYRQALINELSLIPAVFRRLASEIDHLAADVVKLVHDDVEQTFSLSELTRGEVEFSSGAVNPRSWLIEGPPGSGKSTMAARTAIEQAKVEHGPLPIYVDLRRLPAMQELKASGRDIFDHAAEGLTHPSIDCATLLRERSQEANGVCVYFDGLDEVGNEGAMEEARRHIELLLSGPLSRARSFILSRPRQHLTTWTSRHTVARVAPIDPDDFGQLLERWLTDEARSTLQAEIERHEGLAELARNPLWLALMAVIVADREHGNPSDRNAGTGDAAFPSTLVALLDTAVGVLLDGAHHGQASAIEDALRARELLAEVALLDHGSSIGHRKLDDYVGRCRAAAADLDAVITGGDDSPRIRLPDDLRSQLLSLGEKVGFFNANSSRCWGFAHRQIQEFLAAECLVGLDPSGAAALKWIRHEVESGHGERWAQVLAFCCTSAPDPMELLGELASVDEIVALRTIAKVETIETTAALDYVFGLKAWPMEVAETLMAQGATPRAVADFVLRRAGESLDPSVIAKLFHLYRRLCGDASLETFFKSTGALGRPEIERVRVDPPEEESFFIARYPVTNEQLSFLPHAPAAAAGTETLPAANVSWFAADMFCRWVGGSLPSERQWRWAASASRDRIEESDLQAVACFDAGGPRPVGELAPSAFSVHDLQGNVWEWLDERFDPRGPANGTDRLAPEHRMCKGGCWNVAERFCRLDFVNHGPRDATLPCVGFRPVWRVS